MKGWCLKAGRSQSPLIKQSCSSPQNILSCKKHAFFLNKLCVSQSSPKLFLSTRRFFTNPTLFLLQVLYQRFSAAYLLSHFGEIQALQLACEFIQKARLLLLFSLELGLLLID